MSYVLLPYQGRVLGDRSSVRVIEKSRRIGISWAIACEAVVEAARASGCDQWYLGYDEQMAKEFILDAAGWARKFGAAASEVGELMFKDGNDRDAILAYRITFASGHRVTALSSSPRNFRSRQGHAIIDEAAFHDELDEVLKAAMAFLVWGGRVTVISTHNGVDNPFAKLCDDIRAGRKSYSLHSIAFDDALADGLYERICLMAGREATPEGRREWVDDIYAHYGEDADEELRCIPGKGAGSYIKRPLIEACGYDAPVLHLELDDSFVLLPDGERREHVEAWCESNLAPLLSELPDMPHYYGQDFGRVSDLSVVAPVSYLQSTKRRVPFVVEQRNVPYTEQAQVMRYVCDRLPNLMAAWFDATGNGGYLAERATQAYGADVVTEVALSQKWYAEWLPRFRDGFESSLIELPRDADIIRDLLMLRTKNGIPCLPAVKQADLGAAARGRKRATRHGDSAIALALAYCATLGEHVAAAPVDNERRSWMDEPSAGTWDMFR